MARILADRDVKRLIGSVLLDADEKLLNPNGIELRLGAHVFFLSTSEDKELTTGMFLQVNPGESVIISSVESIDFSRDAVQKILPDTMLMGLITPTTTMMREGISQVTTKIDAGFNGKLNWGLRNNSIQKLILQYGEPIFKLTIWALDPTETPDTPYGARERDSYQHTEGIAHSQRRIPVDIPKSKVVSSSIERLDPKKQLKEAGYPFDHIGTELVALHGKFEVVSSDVRVMKEEFTALAGKIDKETSTLSTKIEDTKTGLLESADILFDRKFFRTTGIIVGTIPVVYGAITYLEKTALGGGAIAGIAVVAGVLIWITSVLITRKHG